MHQSVEIQNFCSNIRLLRRCMGLSQKRAAKLLHVSPRTLSRLEAGEMPPRIGCEILFYAQQVYGVSLCRLLGEDLTALLR